jgi:predicted TIM-barrel fold metal-dependent hydrolase
MSQQVEKVSSVDQLDVIVEADGHVTDTPEMTFPYMDDEFDDVKEFYERSPAAPLENSPSAPASPLYVYEYMKKREGKDAFTFFESQDLEPVQEAMDQHGIDKSVVNNLGSVPMRTPRHSNAISNAYNNWLADSLPEYPDIHGNLLLTPLDPEFSAQEIRRVADEDSIVGAQFLGTTLDPLPHDRSYEPVWEAAEDAGIPVCIHTGTGPRSFPQQFFWSETYAEDHVSAHPMQHTSIVTSLVLGGVLERYPDLDILMQEAGIGYVAYLQKRMDDIYTDIGYDLPDVNKPPSEYIDDSVYFGTQPVGHTADNPEHLAWLIEMAGVDNVLWTADVPHPDFDTPEELFDRIKGYFSPDELNKLMGKNAEKLFNI